MRGRRSREGRERMEERTWTVRTVTLLSAAGGGTSEVEGGVPGAGSSLPQASP